MTKQSFRLSFKKQKTNPWTPEYTTIKSNKKEIGTITSEIHDTSGKVWRIRLTVKNDKPNEICAFKWINLKAILSSDQEARDFMIEHWDNIRAKFEIYYREQN